jgi:hypothetical protein
MAGTYRERIDDARLLAVVQHVHDWLWSVAETKKTKKNTPAGKPARPTAERAGTVHGA